MPTREEGIQAIFEKHCPALAEILLRLHSHVRFPRFKMLGAKYDDAFMEQLAADYVTWKDSAHYDLAEFFKAADVANASIDPEFENASYVSHIDLRSEEGFRKVYVGEMFLKAAKEAITKNDPSVELYSSAYRKQVQQILDGLSILGIFIQQIDAQAANSLQELIGRAGNAKGRN